MSEKKKQEGAEEGGGEGNLSPAEAASETDIPSNFQGEGDLHIGQMIFPLPLGKASRSMTKGF